MAKYKIYDELANVKSAYNQSVDLLEAESGGVGVIGGQRLSFSQRAKIRMIEFYSNSKYLNGQKDELGRDKPFYNIVNGVIDVENAAKDLDSKDMEVVDLDGNHSQDAFLFGKEVQVWMNFENWGKTLNDMRDVHSRYGSLLVKKHVYYDENNKKRICVQLPAWKNIWNDQVNLLGSPIVEIQWMLPSEIMKMTEWHKDQKEALIKYWKKTYPRKRRIPVYEMRGEFPRSFYKQMTDETTVMEDSTDYSYQLYYMGGEADGKLFNLYEEDDTEKVYKYLARKPKPGRAFGWGVIEEGEEAQVWTNDAVLKQFRALEYSSKVVGQSASKKLRGRNLLTEVDDGQVLEHEEGKPITTVPLVPAGGMPQFQSLIQQWYDQFEKASSAYDAQRGGQAKSHTPARLQSLQLQQSGSVFKTLRQEFGIFVSEIFNDWIMPFLAEQLTTEHILAAEFTPDELKELDNNYAIYETNKKAKEAILSGKIVSPEDYDAYMQTAKDVVAKGKGRRFLQIPKDKYKDLKAKLMFVTTGEQKDRAAILESVQNIMMMYMKNPAITQDPVLALLFKEIINMSGLGVSSIQLMAAIQEQAKQLQAQKAMMEANNANGGGGNPTGDNTPTPAAPVMAAPAGGMNARP